ncbi:MAG TPA: inositol monophosphatase family protein [Mycobacterium sp.]|nr:inositol monophosphatase family protein [Mycobacterium sp.]
MNVDVDELRATAEQVVDVAARFVRRRRAEMFSAAVTGSVRTKSSPTDPVTVADTETERLVRDLLADLRPGEPILGEEGGGPADGRSGLRWVVDPIDGTVNFLYGIPAYAVSLAAQVDGVSVAGAVADVVSGEIYSAGHGRGATVSQGGESRVLRCTAATELSMVLLGTGFGYQPQRRSAQAELLARLLPVVRDVRRFGSAALDLCHLAAGRLDAYYEHGLNVWDWAAAALIASEAGAVVRTPPESDGVLIAAAPGVAEEFRGVLERLGGLAPLP